MLKNLKGSSLILPLLMLVLTPLGVLADEGPTPGQIAGDNAWMLTSTALVLLMTIPGVALFYGGLSRKQNVLSTLMHVFAGTCVVTITWCVIGYSIAYSEGTPYYGGLGNFLFEGMTFNENPDGLPMGVDVTFQATFAIITTALIAGSFAERIKFSATLIFMAIWSVVVYAPIAHMVWGGGVLAEKGILDFAGGTVVHINCGIAGLVAALVVGKRTGGDSYNTYAPHNLIYTIVGASLLWVGWFGFNAGSALAANETAGNAMLVTQIATAAAALSWMFVEWIIKGKPTVVGIAGGAIAGLVAITPASGFVYPMGALIIGLVAGAACWFFSSVVKTAMGYDDSFDVFGIHGVGGIIGALLTGIFCVPILAGVEPSMEQVGIQFYGILLTIGWCGIGTFVILKAIDMTIGLRVSSKVEKEGLDVNLHGEVVS